MWNAHQNERIKRIEWWEYLIKRVKKVRKLLKKDITLFVIVKIVFKIVKFLEIKWEIFSFLKGLIQLVEQDIYILLWNFLILSWTLIDKKIK